VPESGSQPAVCQFAAPAAWPRGENAGVAGPVVTTDTSPVAELS
jgi:hypothetical protein